MRPTILVGPASMRSATVLNISREILLRIEQADYEWHSGTAFETPNPSHNHLFGHNLKYRILKKHLVTLVRTPLYCQLAIAGVVGNQVIFCSWLES